MKKVLNFITSVKLTITVYMLLGVTFGLQGSWKAAVMVILLILALYFNNKTSKLIGKQQKLINSLLVDVKKLLVIRTRVIELIKREENKK